MRLEVVAPSAMPATQLRASTTWLGEERSVDLLDDGSGADTRAGDGLWTAEWTGQPAQALRIRLAMTTPEQRDQEIFSGTEILRSPEEHLTWTLQLGPPLRAERTALPAPVAEVTRDQVVQVMAALGWAMLVLNYIGWLALPNLRKEEA